MEEDDGTNPINNPVIYPLHHKKTMANNTLDKAIEAIPNFGKRIKLFSEKLRIALARLSTKNTLKSSNQTKLLLYLD